MWSTCSISDTILSLPCWILPPHQCAPLWGHPTQPLLPPHSATGRKWLHTQRMNPHHQTTSPFTSGQRSAKSPGSQCVCLKRAWGWTLINCQWRTVWVTRVFVQTTLWYFRHVWLSTRVARIHFIDWRLYYLELSYNSACYKYDRYVIIKQDIFLKYYVLVASFTVNFFQIYQIKSNVIG